jgi:hypothetical protein
VARPNLLGRKELGPAGPGQHERHL